MPACTSLRPSVVLLAASVAAATALAACSDDAPVVRTTAAFDLAADLSQPESFWELPFPSDLRLRADGTPDLTGYPVRQGAQLFEDLRASAEARPGWPVLPVAYFRFDAPLAPRVLTDVIPAAADAPVLLVDVDPASPERGQLVPTVAVTLGVDAWSQAYLLAIAPRPGFVLVGGRRYAVVVRRGLEDAEGHDLDVPAALATLAKGATPDGPRGPEAAALYAPLFETLALPGLDVPAGDVAAATVFTTGDVVAETAAISTGLVNRDQATIGALTLDPQDGVHPRYCELLTTVSLPQYLTGDEPYDTGGHFELGADGLPAVQKTISVPAVITIPRTPMPAAGYPLALYFHGSGGLVSQVVDRGPVLVAGGPETPGEGPAHVIAAHGFAAASSALPVNPERVPGASDTAYLNFDNLGAFPNLFRQGVIEQRMFLAALAELRIPPEALAGCDGPTLPAGATEYRLDGDNLYAMGQSMGGMYTNLVGAVEPRLRALVPTAAGGFWSFMVLESSLYANEAALLPPLLGTNEPLSFLHPGMALLEMAFEPAEPLVYMPRLSRRPLPGYPARPVYEPVGFGDTYFSPAIYDAVALAYGHQQVGEVVWPSMQDALALEDRGGVVAYPAADNLVSASGDRYTGVVVQYRGDGIYDAHAIFAQLDDVKFQYGCFFATMFESGVATVPAPAPLGSPCLRP